MRKIYTAFISSAFSSLRDERNIVINSLMDFRVVPIGMEHFTVTTNGQFSDIQTLIDESDIFILLLGGEYGSCDKDGISWTEKEYNYALEKKKPTIALICDELSVILEKDYNTLTPTQQKQVDFCNKISFARTVTDEFDIKTIIIQSIGRIDFSKCIGWTRLEDEYLDEDALSKWREEHKSLNVSGKWYHVHLSDTDEDYIRIGTVDFVQEFTPNNYLKIEAQGFNYNVDYYDEEEDILYEDDMKPSRFAAEYSLRENGDFSGLFNSTRNFSGNFNMQEVSLGTRRGIHDFHIISEKRINGAFHDEAPSVKFGRIFLFRTDKERNKFLLKKRADKIKKL